MNAIRKSVWSIVLLGLAVGCGGEPETAPARRAGWHRQGELSVSGRQAGRRPSPGRARCQARRKRRKADEPPAVEGPKAENAKPDSEAAKLTADELAAIKELPAAEQAAAIQQAVCPVSTHHLGSMEKPVKVTAEGRTFYICCEGCEDKVKSDPKASHRQARQEVSGK